MWYLGTIGKILYTELGTAKVTHKRIPNNTEWSRTKIMSIIFEYENSVLISHRKLIDSFYTCLENNAYCMNPDIFDIECPYKTSSNIKRKLKSLTPNKETLRKEIEIVKNQYLTFVDILYADNILIRPYDSSKDNNRALKAAEYVYNASGRVPLKNTVGGNTGLATIQKLGEVNYLFPKNSFFYSKDVSDIQKCLSGKNYDAIVLDPPWWNKYIRRKRKMSDDGYEMMYNHDLMSIPIEKILNDDGLLVIWCTNSEQNIQCLLNEIFPKWNVKYIGKWYWLKITNHGEPICEFYDPPGKQPFERIIFARRNIALKNPGDKKLIVSIPSALHSHKPPLVELIKEFLPEDPSCLEIFARYLLPGWTSYGNEVLRFQHESLYKCTSSENWFAV